MSYQYWPIKKIPFICCICNPIEFPGNYHSEVEVLYCVKGSFSLTIEDEFYTVTAGNAVLINSGLVHERFKHDEPTQVIFIKFASLLLGEFFNEISSLSFSNPVFAVNDPKYPADLKSCFDIFYSFSTKYGGNEGISYHDWMVKSAIFRFATIILENFEHEKAINLKRRHSKLNLRIQTAMSFIEDNFKAPISVEDVSSKLGYEKTYFCKIFKESTGTSFHKFLNKYRVNVAKGLLRSTETPVGEIASVCGFTQFKTFCKVFKAETGLTPTEYRGR